MIFPSSFAVTCGVAAALLAQPETRSGLADVLGAKLYFEDTGGTGEPVVFLHAATGSTRSWEHQVPAFRAAGYRVITFDRRGFGRSERDPAGPAGTAADDLAALAAHLRLGRFHLVGVAAGGFVALDYAVSFGPSLRSLVFAHSMGLVQDPEFLEMGRRIRPQAFEGLPLEFKELSPSYRAANPEGTKRWLEIASSNRPQGAEGARQPVKNRMTAERLASLAMPMLLVAGESDFYMPPPLMRLMAARIPHARTAVVSESAHASFWEQPDVFNREVLAFIGAHLGS